MKKILWVVCMGVVAFGTGSAQAQHCRIEGRAPESENGKTVYLNAYGVSGSLDSAVVRDGKFEFTYEESGIRRLDLGRKFYTNLIAEPGTVRVDLSDPKQVGGTPLNDSLADLSHRRQAFFEAVDEVWQDSTLTEVEKQKKGKEVAERFGTEMEASYKANRDNWFGTFALWSVAHGLSAAEFLASYEEGGEVVREFGPLKRIKQNKEAELATEAGKPFVDFEGVDSTGKAVRLSDYVGKGKYVLVDFWASWCGPCRQETPVIAKAYEKYKDKGLEVLGLFVWDQAKNLGKAVKDLKITWPQIIDSNGVVSKLYGVQGIPHIMLIGPDGTILARNLRGERIDAEIAKHIR